MKAFVFGYQTNYNLGAAIVYAKSKKKAIKLANKNKHVWDTSNCYEIDVNNPDNHNKVIPIEVS